MAQNPEVDVAAALVGTMTFQTPPGGSLALVLGTNLFEGPMRPTPRRAVFVMTSGGPAPETYLGMAAAWRRATVQVVVRGLPDEWNSDQALARAINLFLHARVLAGYVYSHALQSEPNYIGQDEQGCHLWSVNVEVGWKS